MILMSSICATCVEKGWVLAMKCWMKKRNKHTGFALIAFSQMPEIRIKLSKFNLERIDAHAAEMERLEVMNHPNPRGQDGNVAFRYARGFAAEEACEEMFLRHDPAIAYTRINKRDGNPDETDFFVWDAQPSRDRYKLDTKMRDKLLNVNESDLLNKPQDIYAFFRWPQRDEVVFRGWCEGALIAEDGKHDLAYFGQHVRYIESNQLRDPYLLLRILLKERDID